MNEGILIRTSSEFSFKIRLFKLFLEIFKSETDFEFERESSDEVLIKTLSFIVNRSFQ